MKLTTKAEANIKRILEKAVDANNQHLSNGKGTILAHQDDTMGGWLDSALLKGMTSLGDMRRGVVRGNFTKTRGLPETAVDNIILSHLRWLASRVGRSGDLVHDILRIYFNTKDIESLIAYLAYVYFDVKGQHIRLNEKSERKIQEKLKLVLEQNA